MEVDKAIEYLNLFKFKNLPKFKPELINLLKSLEAENKALKKENKAYKGMWGELKIDILRVKSDYWETTFEDVLNNIKVYETKYLGGK
jgi:hypothetical protein